MNTSNLTNTDLTNITTALQLMAEQQEKLGALDSESWNTLYLKVDEILLDNRL